MRWQGFVKFIYTSVFSYLDWIGLHQQLCDLHTAPHNEDLETFLICLQKEAYFL